MDPIIQEYAAKYTNVEFIKIDVDELMVLLIFFSFTHMSLNVKSNTLYTLNMYYYYFARCIHI